MNTPRPTADSSVESAAGPQLEMAARKQASPKRELIYAAIGIVTGFIVLPLLIYMVGTLLLGPYAGGQSLGTFVGSFFANLGQGSPRTWFIALSPYLAFWLVRLCFKRSFYVRPAGQTTPSNDEANAAPTAPPAAQKNPRETRREPFISP